MCNTEAQKDPPMKEKPLHLLLCVGLAGNLPLPASRKHRHGRAVYCNAVCLWRQLLSLFSVIAQTNDEQDLVLSFCSPGC